MPSPAEEVAEILLNIGAVSLRPNEPYTYTSGIKSPIYTDNRLLISYPKERRRVIDLWIEMIKGIGEFDVIAGTSTAGIPHAAWISDKMDKPMVYIRGEAKKHGKGSQIEGLMKPGHKVIIVEDLISTGGSAMVSHKAVLDGGGVNSDVAAIFTYTLSQSAANFAEAGVKLTSLSDFPTLVEVAAASGRIKPEEQAVVLDWVKDSAGWGKRHGHE